MHAAELADEIYKRRLYLKKDGSKAEYTQIRARCGHYPDMFEALPGNFIKLKEDYKK
jgi:antitoxin Phd